MSTTGYMDRVMSFLFKVPAHVFKKYLTSVLQQYLKEELDLDEVQIDFNSNATARLNNLTLDEQKINELLRSQGCPLELVSGYLGHLHAVLPLFKVLVNNGHVEIDGLELTFKPTAAVADGTSMYDSMVSSEISDAFAQECKATASDGHAIAGVELLKNAFDSVLNRIKVKFTNTVINLQYNPDNGSKTLSLQVKIKSMEYMDESQIDPSTNDCNDKSNNSTGFRCGRCLFQGVTLSTNEFTDEANKEDPLPEDLQFNDDSEVLQTESDIFKSCTSKSFLDEDCSAKSIIDDEEINNNEPILFARLSGTQEIHFKKKNGESIRGPTLEIGIEIGAVSCFLTPRQLHLINEVISGLLHPPKENLNDNNRDMTASEYKRMENILQNICNSPASYGGLSNIGAGKGWSSASLGDIDNDDEFQSFNNEDMTSSIMSVNSLLTMSTSGSSTYSQSSRGSKKTRTGSVVASRTGDEYGTEISVFNVRVSSIGVVLLHEDILTNAATNEPSELPQLSHSSVQNLRKTSKSFFEYIGPFSAFGSNDFSSAITTINQACKLNHLSFLAMPIIFDVRKETNMIVKTYTGTVTAANLILQECLTYEDSDFVIPLVVFTHIEKEPNSGVALKPKFLVTFKQSQQTLNKSLSRFGPSKTEVSVAFEPFLCEVDITIAERISAVLQTPVWDPVHNISGHMSEDCKNTLETGTGINLQISCTMVDVKLRFPVVDMRPPHDPAKKLWWTRNVQPDYLSFIINNLSVSQFAVSIGQKFQIKCRNVQIFYSPNETEKKIYMGCAGLKQEHETGDPETEDYRKPRSYDLPHDRSGLDWLRMFIEVYPTQKTGSLDYMNDYEVQSKNVMTGSMIPLASEKPRNPSPFSSKVILHASDTMHPKENGETEDFVIPGDIFEMQEFSQFASKNSKVHIELSIPHISIELRSKHLFEVLYNRIITDLLLWESSVPQVTPSGATRSNFTENVYPAYGICKSGTQLGDDSDNSLDSDDSENEMDRSFMSTRHESSFKTKQPMLSKTHSNQSKLSFKLNIRKGLMTIFSPVRDSLDHVIPGQQGEFVVQVDDLTLFTVSEYLGNRDETLLYVDAESAKLNHCGLMPVPFTPPPFREVGSILPQYLDEIVYHTPLDTHPAQKDRSRKERGMLSVAIRIEANPEIKHKKIRVALGIQEASLRYIPAPFRLTWLSEMIDFFNVQDYPVAGYVPSTVVTELYTHLWDCSVDYRPKNLSLRSMLSVGNFSLCTNIIAESKSSNLRIIAEDCAVFLAEMKNKESVSLKKKVPFVCVVDLGLFNLSLRQDNENPLNCLRVSNSDLNIRICADTAKALCLLIGEIATEGKDTQDESVSDPHGAVGNVNLLGTQNIPNQMTRSQEIYITNEMEDAIKEEYIITRTKDEVNKNDGVVPFEFDDERSSISEEPTIKQVSRELGNPSRSKENSPTRPQSSDTDDEYCFVDREPKYIDFTAKPDVYSTEEPYFVDNHFKRPQKNPDVLDAPDSYPVPVNRVTLCKMSCIMHVFGGNDFEITNTSEERRKSKAVTYSDRKYSASPSSVSFNKASQNIVSLYPTTSVGSRYNWKERGGVNRDYDTLMQIELTKLRFVYEMYPHDGVYDSRQALAIGGIEIRDRLKVSQFNKFLHSKKESSPNMVVMKALHLRPNPEQAQKECSLRVTVTPLIKLNIDQDSLDFLMKFSNEVSAGQSAELGGSKSHNNTPTRSLPVIAVPTPPDHKPIEKNTTSNDLMSFQDGETCKTAAVTVAPISSSCVDDQTYFKSFTFTQDVVVRVNYRGKRNLDTTHGFLASALMALTTLNNSEIKLNRIAYNKGISGVEKLVHFCLHQWSLSIKNSQIPAILSSVGPFSIVTELVRAFIDLFWIPCIYYQRGSFLTGVRLGANSFSTRTVLACLEISSTLIHGVQAISEVTYDIVSPGPGIANRDGHYRGKRRNGRTNRVPLQPPSDIREGVTNAYHVFKDGLSDTAGNIVRVAALEHSHKGVSGAVGGVLRQIPPTVVAPFFLAAAAGHNIVGGITSSLVPASRQEARDKYRSE